MTTLQELLGRARKEHWAIGHFNVSNLEQMRAIVRVCKELGSPAMLGTSEGERGAIGLFEAVALRQALRHEFDIPVFLNADHSKSVDTARAAVEAGYDSVHLDLSAKPFAENVVETRDFVAYARAKSPGISIEGEVGYLVTESSSMSSEKVDVPEASLATPELAEEFVKKTGVDRLAPALGSFHGISTATEKTIHVDLVAKIRAVVPDSVALVLHGGSGLSEQQIKDAIAVGINNVHINTELRVAYVGGIKEHLAAHPDDTTPYKLSREGIEAMAEVLKNKLELFGATNKL